MSDSLFENYWFVLSQTGRARGLGAEARPSAGAMRRSLLSAAAKRKPRIMVKITRFGNRGGLAAHLTYISRYGKGGVFDPSSESFYVIAEQLSLSARDTLQHLLPLEKIALNRYFVITLFRSIVN